MRCTRGGGAPRLLLALSLSWLAAAALPAPRPSNQRSQHALNHAIAAEGDALLPGRAAAAAASAGSQGRSLLKQPLPNFEIGVPAPPKKEFSKWQSLAVRERRQELSSSTFLAPNHPGKDYVSLCVVARDAHADMLEWLNHHIRLGVGKVYLWDHASEPPMKRIVQGYIDAGLVEYEHLTSFVHASGKPQLYAYDECLARHGHKHSWMGFIDVDEFLMFRDPWPAVQSLPALLQQFEGPNSPPNANSGLAVHWLIFGSSGHDTRPKGGVLRSYTRCIRLRHAQHALVKTIVRTQCTVSAEGPHNFRHNCTLPVLQTDRTPIQGARSEEPVHKRLALHHYAIKSREEFELKMLRGSAMKRQRGWEFFAFIDEWSTELNFDGLTLWDTQTAFHHYPGVTKAQLQRYQAEQHEDFWLKGADDPRYKEQLRQQEAAKQAAAQQAGAATQAQQAQRGAGAAGGGAAAEAAAGGAAEHEQQQQQGQQQGRRQEQALPDPAGAAQQRQAAAGAQQAGTMAVQR